MNSTGVELQAVRLDLTPETHQQLRIEAARQDMSMAAPVRSLVAGHLAKRKGSAK
jgi:hypothetical protein